MDRLGVFLLFLDSNNIMKTFKTAIYSIDKLFTPTNRTNGYTCIAKCSIFCRENTSNKQYSSYESKNNCSFVLRNNKIYDYSSKLTEGV